MHTPRLVQDWNYDERVVTRLPESTPQQAIEQLIQGKIEACSKDDNPVIAAPFHPLMASLHKAFSKHLGIILSPDMLWLMIAQGLATHINQQPEAYRSQFVKRDDKATITVTRHGFIKGSSENPWEGVFDEFSQVIKADIGEEHHSRIVVNFSTTGPVEKAANEIVLMESMKNYYSYHVYTRCSIPRVALEGTEEDWLKLRERTEAVGTAYQLQWWTDRLLPTLDTIVESFRGAENIRFWRSIYKWEETSGSDNINGWILDFFPYLRVRQQPRRNWKFDEAPGTPADFENMVRSSNIPGSLSVVPFLWLYEIHRYPMEFLAGFTYFTQDEETLALRPKIGWAVRDASDRSN